MNILRKGVFTVYSEYKSLLKTRLDEKRYYHSLCVADEAKRLALKCGVDTEQAYLAGLLHDVTKNASKQEHLQIFKQFGIILNDIELNAQKLWHAISGAKYIEKVLSQYSTLSEYTEELEEKLKELGLTYENVFKKRVKKRASIKMDTLRNKFN